MSRSNRSMMVVAPLLAALAASTAGCGGSGSSRAAKATPSLGIATTPPATPAKALKSPPFTRVIVTATDNGLAFSVSSYRTGNYTFSLTNRGTKPHALEINGPGLHMQVGATVKPGQSTDLVVPLKSGSYELWSPVGADRSSGLATHIVVVAG